MLLKTNKKKHNTIDKNGQLKTGHFNACHIRLVQHWLITLSIQVVRMLFLFSNTVNTRMCRQIEQFAVGIS